MSNRNVIEETKQALLAYKEKILDEIKYSETRIDDFRANLTKIKFNGAPADSSDSDDDFLSAIDLGPSITQLKLQQTTKKTSLHATQELTGLTVLQSEVEVLDEEPKFEGERPVTEAGIWTEVTAECRIDLVPFTMTLFMHTPTRKFGPPSYRGLRVTPVKSSHELELSKSVLHSLKRPSDAVEVLRSYAVGYRSRRTTLARLANKFTNALFMEPHPEGGFVMKCADLLEVSWKLQNKWSPVAPFHHKMKFDLEFMEESYIKIITQAHKELLDPALQTDERTLLLAKIIATCLEARGPIDPESDLESKTTERDNDIDRRDSDNEKRDSEVMAPPKSLPKKTKQKKPVSLPNTADKRKMDDETGDSGAKKMKNDAFEAKKNITDNNNPRKSKISDVVSEGGKKRKISEANKVVSSQIVKETGNIEDGNIKSKESNKENKTSNTKAKNVKETDKNAKKLKENEDNNAEKPKNMKGSASNKDTNTKTNIKTKNKISKERGDTAAKETNLKPKVLKDPAKIESKSKPKTKILKNTVKNQENGDNDNLKDKNTIDTVQNKESTTKKVVKEASNTDKVKNNVNRVKNTIMKETGNVEEKNDNGNKNIVENIANVKSKENIDVNKDAERPISNITGKNTNNEKTLPKNVNKIDPKLKNTDSTKVKNVASAKNNDQTTKKGSEKNINVASAKNDDQSKKVNENNDKNKAKLPEIANKGAQKNIKEITSANNVKNVTQTVKKVTEKSATNVRNKDKISPIGSAVSEKIVTSKLAPIQEKPEKVSSSNINTKNKNIIKKPIINKIPSHRNSLKPQNHRKVLKAGSTKSHTTGNIEKENGGKGTKIPMKLTSSSEGSSKKYLLRESPRGVPSKSKTRYTNIPRLLKKSATKTT